MSVRRTAGAAMVLWCSSAAALGQTAAPAASPGEAPGPQTTVPQPPATAQPLSTAQPVDTAQPIPTVQTPPIAQAATSPALPAAANGRLAYEGAFFSTFSPANALQVVERTPGFTLDVGDETVRGFGQAAGNVVINGQRPSAKSDTLSTILQRIPASRVLRVEVGRGDLFGAEFAGRPQVLNLVLTAGGGLAGTVEGTVYRDFTGKLFPEGTASALLRRGNSSFNLAVGIDNERTSEEGYDRVTARPSRAELEFRRKVNRIEDPNGYISGSWEHSGGEGRSEHLNGRIAVDHFALTQSNDVFPAAGPVRDDRLTQRYFLRSWELGGDYSRPFAGGTIKLIGLATRRKRANDDVSLLRVNSEVVDGSTQSLNDRREETVVRTVWSRSDLFGWSVETGVEGTHNRLTSDVDLAEIGGGRIDLPVDQATVEEFRGEAFLNAGKPLTKRLRLDLGITFEASELTVSGDAEAQRVLRFLKPQATLDWRSGNGWHAQASLKRTVAQLQFEDFISSAELTNERVNGGNAELLPQRAWEFLTFVERPILKDGLVRLEGGYNRISLVQDRVPTPEGFDAPGNLGSGELLLARARVDAPLGRVGIKGGRVTLYASYVRTRVADPYTGDRRPFSGNSPFLFEANFRQDLRRFAWGFGLEGSEPSVFYRLDEEDENYGTIPYVTAFAEYRPTARSTVTLGVRNLTDVPAFRKRTFFRPDRRTPEPSQFELRKRNQHVIGYLTFKHSFG